MWVNFIIDLIFEMCWNDKALLSLCICLRNKPRFTRFLQFHNFQPRVVQMSFYAEHELFVRHKRFCQDYWNVYRRMPKELDVCIFAQHQTYKCESGIQWKMFITEEDNKHALNILQTYDIIQTRKSSCILRLLYASLRVNAFVLAGNITRVIICILKEQAYPLVCAMWLSQDKDSKQRHSFFRIMKEFRKKGFALENHFQKPPDIKYTQKRKNTFV